MASAIITKNPTPRFIEDGFYLVDSRTSTLVTYQVRNLEHGWQCNCAASASYKVCWHVTAVLALEAAAEVPELEEDLLAITEYLAEDEGRVPFSPNYSDGTPKPYSQGDSHRAMIRKAQASWAYEN